MIAARPLSDARRLTRFDDEAGMDLQGYGDALELPEMEEAKSVRVPRDAGE
ncbi:MAG: hypothetical protein R3E97_05680 [Candidatus Eisenbacteria bacterium]